MEYVGRYKNKDSAKEIDIQVEDIDIEELMESDSRLEKIVDYVLAYHNTKTHNKEFTALFCVSSIPSLIKYYELFQRKKMSGEHNLKIATIFSFIANENDADANGLIPEEILFAAEPEVAYSSNSHTREKLDDQQARQYRARIPEDILRAGEATLTRSVSEDAKSLPRLRFGSVWNVSFATACSREPGRSPRRADSSTASAGRRAPSRTLPAARHRSSTRFAADGPPRAGRRPRRWMWRFGERGPPHNPKQSGRSPNNANNSRAAAR